MNCELNTPVSYSTCINPKSVVQAELENIPAKVDSVCGNKHNFEGPLLVFKNSSSAQVQSECNLIS